LLVDKGGGNIVHTYNAEGLPLEPGLVEVITHETTAPGQRHANLAGHEGEIAVKSWKVAITGVAPFTNPSQIGGVGWILATTWMPYQLSSFVTPPFPGLASGHSTFSRSAAEIRDVVVAAFPNAKIDYQVDAKRQGIVDSWPADVDDSAARADWGFAPTYDFERAFREYLIPTIQQRYRR